ncbi:MAG: hypothetical protein WCY38_06500 [Endomicrobiia bacterium]
MALEKTKKFIKNASIEELTERLEEYGIEFENYQMIRVDLTMKEIEKLRDGEVVQTQYPWLQIGRRLDF